MKIEFITIMIRDMEKSLRFYTEFMGLKVIREIEQPVGHIRFVADAAEETKIELIEFNVGPKVETNALTIAYTGVRDLEALRTKALEMGYEPTEIFRNGPEPVNFKVADPDGVMIEFVQ